MKFFRPIDYIKIDLANQYGHGLDKQSFEDRIAWADTNEKNLEALEAEAEDRYRYASARLAYRDVQAGKTTGHLVGLDASSSGPQIMSALMRDIVGAENTSLTGKSCNDLYQITTNVMNSLLTTEVSYDRKTVKYALMPHYYGSIARPQEAFGHDTPEYKAFMEATQKVCPGAAVLMHALRRSWNPGATEHSFTLPDGFVAKVKVTAVKETNIEVDELNHLRFKYQYTELEGKDEGVANIANPIQAIDGFIVREMNRRCNYDKVQFSRVLSLLKRRANQKSLNSVLLDSIQEVWANQNMVSLVDLEELQWEDVKTFDFNYCDQLMVIVKRCLERPSFPVIMVHDEFQTHPNYSNWSRLTYAEIMAEISDSTLIDDILSKLYNKPIRIQKLAESISAEILEGQYAIS